MACSEYRDHSLGRDLRSETRVSFLEVISVDVSNTRRMSALQVLRNMRWLHSCWRCRHALLTANGQGTVHY